MRMQSRLCDYSIRTDKVIAEHRPDLTPVDKTNNKVSLIDVAVTWDSRAEQKEQEKDKYQAFPFRSACMPVANFTFTTFPPQYMGYFQPYLAETNAENS